MSEKEVDIYRDTPVRLLGKKDMPPCDCLDLIQFANCFAIIKNANLISFKAMQTKSAKLSVR